MLTWEESFNHNWPHCITAEHQRLNLDLLSELNRGHLERHPGKDQLAARMENYELAFRMQMQSARDIR